MTNHIARYESWLEMVELADSPLPNDYIGEGQSHHSPRMPGFNQTDTWEECLELAKHGWQDEHKQVMELLTPIEDELKPLLVNSFKAKYDVTGSDVDIDRFLMGEPENMIEYESAKISQAGRVVTILVNMSFSSFIDAKDIIKRGIAVSALIESIEATQQQVELWVEQTVSSSNGRSDSLSTVLVKVKNAGEPLDIDRVMFAVAHPDSLRRIIFGVEEHLQNAKFRKDFGFQGGMYGRPATNPELAEMVGADIVLPMMQRNDLTFVDPERWIKENLDQLGLLREDAE